ncbi:MAG: T9SS type A sorting domain-containing protein [Melioribacteraceae bacterium]
MKNLKYFLVVIFLFQGLIIAQTVYEDAEDGAITRWAVYDDAPTGSTIINVFDGERGSKVIKLDGSGTDNGFSLTDGAPYEWDYMSNSSEFILEWSMKTSNLYEIYAYINTSAGLYYLNYSADDITDVSVVGEYVYYGLGADSKDGTWQTFERNLKTDFESAVPGQTISEVKTFLIRCQDTRLDDLKLKTSALPVELTTFTASAKNSKVSLVWETATEVNNYGFEIQKQNQVSSIENQDKNQNWESISFIEGHGNSNSPKYYEFNDNSTTSGKYFYRLKQIDIDGTFEYSKIVEVDLGLPTEFELSQNYPNPFNPTTNIKYSIPNVRGNENLRSVQLRVYDVLGNEVANLINKNQEAGSYKVSFDASNLTSGIYFYTLNVGSFVETKKMILLR